jgi:hypothetical protein
VHTICCVKSNSRQTTRRVRQPGAAPGWTLPSAATVRSEAEDERRSREAISPGAHFNQELTEAQCSDRSANVAFFATFSRRDARDSLAGTFEPKRSFSTE